VGARPSARLPRVPKQIAGWGRLPQNEGENMKNLLAGFCIVLVLLAGCANHSGKYAPDCVAFEGDTVDLTDGRFVLEKFTDQVEVDESGNKIDPFPSHPMRGTYRFEGDVLHMQSDAGTDLPNWYLVKSEGRKRLLTSEQYDAWKKDGTIDDCALTLGAGDGA